jgi:hypothetical protein
MVNVNRWQNHHCKRRQLPDVVITIAQKFPKNVDGHDPQTGLSFDFQDSQNSFVQDRVSDILC